MRSIIVEKEGQKFKWTVEGLNEKACLSDIEFNKRVLLTDYVATMFSDRYGCIASVEQVREMTHNQFRKFLEDNASRLYTDGHYTIEDYNRDADSVVILDYDLDRFHLSEDVQKIINRFFDTDEVNSLGHALFRGHLVNDNYIGPIANYLGCESVCLESYRGFYKSDANKCLFSYCEGDINLVLCENEKEYQEEVASYCNFYEIENDLAERDFKVGSYNLYLDDKFENKAYNEIEVDSFILYCSNEYPGSSLKVTQDVMDGINESCVDVTSDFLDRLRDKLPQAEIDACIEVYFDGVHMDNVFCPMSNANAMISSLVQYGYENYNVDVKEDWERDGGRKNPDLSFKVVDYPAKAVDKTNDLAVENMKVIDYLKLHQFEGSPITAGEKVAEYIYSRIDDYYADCDDDKVFVENFIGDDKFVNVLRFYENTKDVDRYSLDEFVVAALDMLNTDLSSNIISNMERACVEHYDTLLSSDIEFLLEDAPYDVVISCCDVGSENKGVDSIIKSAERRSEESNVKNVTSKCDVEIAFE